MKVRFDRIARIQAAMREKGWIAIVVLNHDDYRYLFGTDRAQPRAIIPFQGPPELIAFTGEEPELRAALADGEIRVFGSVGGQIHDVVGRLRELAAVAPPEWATEGRHKVGLQMWFHTPAFLIDMFRQVNPMVEVVSSDAVMDPLRMIKEPDELALLTQAQRIAGLGMDRARELLRPGVSAQEIATEATYTMMKAGAEGTSTPVYVNFGIETCMLHGRLSPAPLERGQLVLIDLTPTVDGYCANLARSFVLGEPDAGQAQLISAYRQIVADVRAGMRPGVTVAQLDELAHKACESHGFGEYQVYGIGHGIGLRFEEPPASTIIPPHKNLRLAEGMTVTIGHTILAIPGFGGVRFEDIYRVGGADQPGAQILSDYPIDPIMAL
ncbi:MAG TPA: Xaa-Pro peptidase family protein [Candidatus Limnocylindrales bacterium]